MRLMIRFIFAGFILLCVLNAQTPSLQTQETAKTQEVKQEQAKKSNDDRGGFVIGIFGGASLMGLSSDYYKNLVEIEWMEKNTLGVSPNYGVKLGYDVYFLPQHGMRIYLDYMGSNFLDSSLASGKINLHTFALNVEYKFEINDFLGVFAGVNLNYSLLDAQKIGKQGALGVGANAGFTFGLASWAEFELGLHYLGDSFQDRQILVDSIGANHGATHLKISFDSLLGLRFGFTFKF